MAFKRKRVSAPRRSVRRRFRGGFKKSTGRRRFAGGSSGRTAFVSAQDGRSFANGFRSRRMSKSAWRRSLWTSTLHKAHYRSVETNSVNIAAPVVIDTAALIQFQALAGDFFTVAGGLQQIDAGIPPPLFSGDITLRGGISKLSFSNNGTGDAVKVRVFTCWTNRNPDQTILPGTVPSDWDPSLIPEFERFGKVTGMREFFLLPGNRPSEISYRYKPRKIDLSIYTNGGEQLMYIVTISSTSTLTLGGETVTFLKSHNVSFAGDAV